MDAASSSRDPELSVVVPIRNEERHIRSVLDQLAGQTLDPVAYEILVVDGRSEDRTRDVVAEVAAVRPNVRLLDNPRFQSGSARNIGAREGRGRYVLFVDGHCRIQDPGMLTAALEAFRRGEKCLSRPQPLIDADVGDFARAVCLARRSILGHNAGSHIFQDRDVHVDPTSAGCGYERAFYLGLGGIDESFDAAEDLEFNLRVHRAGYQALHSQRFSIAYFPRDSFRGLLRQLYRYGYGRARMARKHPGAWSPLAALLAAGTAAVPLLALGGVLLPVLWRVLGLGAAVYAAACLLAAAGQARGPDRRLWLSVAACFPAIHLGSGLGYLAGLAGGPSGSHRPRS